MIKYETDSRLVKPNQCFVAIIGHTVDGHNYINEAINNGATEIVISKDVSISDTNIKIIKANDTEEYLKNKLIDEYSEKLNSLKIIGVTGTNGKTTTCYLTYQLLQKLNINVTYIGTIGYYHKETFISLENTTPDILTLYKLLYKALDSNCTHIVMEVSSHALALQRLAGLNLSCASFTNLTQDHLDYHNTMEEYLNSKLLIINLLKKDAPFIINNDDQYGKSFEKAYSNSKTIGTNGDYKINNYEIKVDKIKLNFEHQNISYNATINLTSKFNIYNYLTAIAMLNELGFNLNELIKLSTDIIAPKGRCETIKVSSGFAVVDYAHTPDAVEKVITAYNELKENKVITIIGCGGDRDPKKRPIMGNIATSLSDYTILTNDNPRTENPNKIMEDIIKGVKVKNYEIVLDRKEAIKKGINMLKENDILLILGKGHENYQIIGKVKNHFDDLEEVLNWKKD